MTEDLAAASLRFAADLIRIDTTNTGDPATTAGERAAAEYVAAVLTDAGLQPRCLEPEPRRTSVIARVQGRDRSRGALLVHAHLDVVPAVARDWTVPPFAGEVVDGWLWGRGAVDMKHAVAMALAAVQDLLASGGAPERDVVLAFVADEERGGRLGAHWLVEEHADLFEGVTDAVGEVGGFSVPLGRGRCGYLVQTAEKGGGTLTLRARGRAGHGSLPRADNAVARLAEVVARLQRHRFPVVLTDATRELLVRVERHTGRLLQLDGARAEIDPLTRIAYLGTRDTVSVTRFDAGYAANVVPAEATATVDCRILPGRLNAFEAEVADLLHGIEWELQARPGLEAVDAQALLDDLTTALRAEDAGAVLLPYLMPASTDAKSFERLGIRCLGFTPTPMPADVDYLSLFHAVDERVPVASLGFGARVLRRLLAGGSGQPTAELAGAAGNRGTGRGTGPAA